MPTALDDIFVLDLTRVLAGPSATQILGDLGADVIKVEKPGQGDDTRHWGPPFSIAAKDGSPVDAAYFLGTNRNKRSIEVDMAHPQGAELVRALAAQADILVENFKVGGLRRYGLDYKALRAINPRLIYCSITGFGQSGPAAARPGYDFAIQAMGGLMSVTGHPDDTAGGTPMKTGVAVADLFTGVYAATAILAALVERGRSGEGQHIDMALFDAQVAMLANQAGNYLATGTSPERLGNAHPNLVPYELLPTATEDLVVAVGNDRQFAALCAVLGLDALGTDPRFARNADRVRHRDLLIGILRDAMRAHDAVHWAERLDAAGVPCAPVNRIADVFRDPQSLARGHIVEQQRADLGDLVRGVASPIRLSRTPVRYDLPPPARGEHTDQVLAERLGLASPEIEALRASDAIGGAGSS